MGLGLALSGALRWTSRHRRTRSVLVPLGLNFAALALLGAVLAAGSEPGGLGVRWTGWLVPGGLALGAGTLAFRFPRSVGLPVLSLGALLGWGVIDALGTFTPLGAVVRTPTVQPLTDRELVTAFAIQADWVELPDLPLAPRVFYRLRTSSAPPTDWWWPWAASRGWARSVGAPIPEQPLKFGVYRLELGDGNPVWRLVSLEGT